jgi:adenylate cyclase
MPTLLNLGLTEAVRGDLETAHQHMEESEALYEPERHALLASAYGLDYGVGTKVHLAWLAAYFGYFERSRKKSQEAITFARRGQHAHTLSFALRMVGIADMRRRDWKALDTHAEEALELADKHGFLHLTSWSLPNKGLAQAALGNTVEGIELIHRGMDMMKAMRSKMSWPQFCQMLTQALIFARRWPEAQAALDEMSSSADKRGELLYVPQIPLMQGTILQGRGRLREAEESFLQTIEIAQSKNIKLFELDGSVSLARIWNSQGKRTEALELLCVLDELRSG